MATFPLLGMLHFGLESTVGPRRKGGNSRDGFDDGEDSMKRIAVAILLVSSYCHAQGADGFQPASTNVWGAEYPRVDASGRAEFRIKAPNATAVKLNFWSNPKLDMVK